VIGSKICPSHLAYLVLSPIPISLHHAMVTVMGSKDEPYYIPEELDDSMNRIYWKVLACPAPGCSEASFKKTFICSFINPERLIDYLALHLNRSSLHDTNQQQAYDTAAAWVVIEDNAEECTETFADRQEYHEQIKRAHRNAQNSASRARTPSRGREASVQQRERGDGQHSKQIQRSQNQERSRSARRDGTPALKTLRQMRTLHSVPRLSRNISQGSTNVAWSFRRLKQLLKQTQTLAHGLSADRNCCTFGLLVARQGLVQ
jgi:hypothetical protein